MPSPQAFRWTAALLAALLCASVHAAPAINASLVINPSLPNEFGPFSRSESSTDPIAFSGVAGGLTGSEGSGSVSARYGVLKTSGAMEGRGAVGSFVMFSDMVTVTVPGVSVGREMDLSFEVLVTGNLDIGPLGTRSYAQWKLDAHYGFGSPEVSLYGELRDAGNGAAYGGSAFGTYSATVRVRNGSSYRVSMRMEGAALAGSVSSSGWASYDLGNSAYWGGITSVRVGGAEVSSYVLSSESGTDYRNSMAPIPEPGALAMMLAGLGVLVGLQRRRRR